MQIEDSVHSHKRVYLSGGMEYAADEGRDWRSTMQDWLERNLHCEVFNPNRESDRLFRTHHPDINFRQLKANDIQRYSRIATELVDLDCKEIAERSDFVICYWDDSAMKGAGTKGELTMARHFRKPVYMVTTLPHHEIQGWVLGCVTRMFSSFEELKAFLLQ
jgi:hypothetical protein